MNEIRRFAVATNGDVSEPEIILTTWHPGHPAVVDTVRKLCASHSLRALMAPALRGDTFLSSAALPGWQAAWNR